MNTIQSTKDAQDQLEQLIDTHGLPNVVEMLSIVAFEKAEHVQVNWQDKVMAKSWERAGNRLYRMVGAMRAILG